MDKKTAKKHLKMSDDIAIGWENIAHHTPYSASSLRQRFGKKMMETGYVIKEVAGRKKRPRVWAYVSMVKMFFMLLNRKNTTPDDCEN